MNRSRQLLRATGLATALTLAGCKSNSNPAQTANGQDPADANLAQPYTGGDAGGYNTAQTSGQAKVLGQSQSYSPQASGESYETQAPAPIIRQAPSGNASSEYYPVPQAGAGQGASYSNDGQPYTDAEEAGEQALAETDQAPPPLPEYDQPPAPEDDYIWTPGYWNYASAGYYWVPGVWCAPPFYGALWTPPWWGFYGGHYLFHRGYWGPHVGYYGGINYGFGYIGVGYFGGYWHGHDFFYNRAVTNVNVTNIHNVYSRTVVYNNVTYGPRPMDRVSYNGGPGGRRAQPTPQELGAMHEAHYAPVAAQRQNRVAAADNHAQFFAANHGHPAEAFRGHPVGAPGNIAANAAAAHDTPLNHPGAGAPPRDLGNGHPATPGNPAAANVREFNHSNNNRPIPPNQPGFDHGRPDQRSETQIGTPAPQHQRPETHIGTSAPQDQHPETHIGTPAPQHQRPETHIGTPAQPSQRPEMQVARPAYDNSRANGLDRPRQPAAAAEQSRPAVEPSRMPQAQPAPRPEMEHAAPQQARPQPQVPHPAAAPHPQATQPHPVGSGGNHGRPQ